MPRDPGPRHQAFAVDGDAVDFADRLLMWCEHEGDRILVTMASGEVKSLASLTTTAALAQIRLWWAAGEIPTASAE